MIRSVTRGAIVAAAFLGAALVGQAASATSFTFSFTGAGQSAGAWQSLNYSQTKSSEDLSLSVFGGHLNGSGTGVVSVSAAGVQSWQNAGLGVLFDKDNAGDGSHQLDNASGSSDFVALVFSKDVTLSSIFRTNFSSDYWWPATGYDTDASFQAYTGSTLDLLGGVNLGKFTALNDTATSTGSTATSKIWLIAANVTGQRNDAFKLSSIVANTVTPAAVPEPASWAMMIAGFGSIGAAMRRRRKPGVVAIG